MKLKQFLEIFPNAVENPLASDYFCITVEKRRFGLPENDLSQREKNLLSLLLETNPPHSKNKWYQRINDNFFDNDYKFRMIQFSNNQKINQTDFLTSVELLIPNVESVFFLNDFRGIIIERYKTDHISIDELKGIFQAMGADFSMLIKCYVGLFYDAHEYQNIFYRKEAEIFNHLINQTDEQELFTYADYFLGHLDAFNTKDAIAGYLCGRLETDKELIDLIKELWKSENSLSMASQNLFIHRNTLQYKLKKFQEEFGFSLKSLKELTLCYLLIINKEKISL